eukprot:COSAG02_NODE_1105_length_14545_cov_15.280701_7_plen_216_part_00
MARSRCQCLMSVDDAYAAIDTKLTELGKSSDRETYLFITSDHGYNLGGHRMTSNKMMPYEHSLRIPMVVAGPGIPKGGLELHVLGTQVDLAPTWLALAGLDTPPTMDGRSIAHVLIPNPEHPDLKVSTRLALARHINGLPSLSHVTPEGAQASAQAFRTETFHQYYSAGNCWSPTNGGDQCPICGNGTASDNSRSQPPYTPCHHGICPKPPGASK